MPGIPERMRRRRFESLSGRGPTKIYFGARSSRFPCQRRRLVGYFIDLGEMGCGHFAASAASHWKYSIMGAVKHQSTPTGL